MYAIFHIALDTQLIQTTICLMKWSTYKLIANWLTDGSYNYTRWMTQHVKLFKTVKTSWHLTTGIILVEIICFRLRKAIMCKMTTKYNFRYKWHLISLQFPLIINNCLTLSVTSKWITANNHIYDIKFYYTLKTFCILTSNNVQKLLYKYLVVHIITV
jgi:hypothetical protein